MNKMRVFVSDFEDYDERIAPWSIVYVEINGMVFPSGHWWDATSSVLEMWIDNLHRLIIGSTDTCILHYMDGDYSIKLTLSNPPEALAVFLDPREVIILSETIDLFYFARQLLTAVAKLKMFYEDYSETRFIKNLDQAAEKLRTTLKEYRNFMS